MKYLYQADQPQAKSLRFCSAGGKNIYVNKLSIIVNAFPLNKMNRAIARERGGYEK